MRLKRFFYKNLKIFLFLLSIVITILLGSLVGIILAYQKGFPNQIRNLEDMKPKVMTTILDDQRGVVKEFAIEKRVLVRSSDIPEFLKKALITAEDNQFASHFGVNIRGSIRALIGRIFKKNWGGGSSITQQLARGLFLTPEVTLSRKIKEMLLAIQIERQYSKDQILTFYANKIFFGGPIYGVEAASRHYFGKTVQEINVAEAALLSAIIPNPNRLFNIFTSQENCLRRRNYILQKMLDFKYINKNQYDEAVKVELPDKPFNYFKEETGDYYHEEIRRFLDQKYGSTLVYQGGIKVYSTLNNEMQHWAESALRDGLHQLDKRIGWRKSQPLLNLLKDKTDLKTYKLPSWKKLSITKDNLVEGIILNINSKRAVVRINEYKGTLDKKDASWTKEKIHHILKKGDVALFKILDINKKKKELKLSLEQEPEVQGAILVVENKTGEIKAMVGGYSYEKSEWNRTTQAPRQPGSTFKPILYTAALENGYTPATMVVDEPFVLIDQWTGEVWEPQNEDGEFKGPLTFRRAFELSRIAASARVIQQITPQTVVNYGKRFGITTELKPYHSLALGSSEVKLIDIVGAYTVFPNLGVRVKPYFIKTITDQNNNILEENFPDRTQVIEPNVAFIMNSLLQGVVTSGTAVRARNLKAPIGGKTGTTNDYTDAWFIGFSPSITVGVWIGYDVKRSMGKKETGSRAALPVFIKFMDKYLEKYPEVQKFRKPSGVIVMKVDKYTGKLWTPDCIYTFWESFMTGTEPTEFCNSEEHDKIVDYYTSGIKEDQ